MGLTITALTIAMACGFVFVWMTRRKNQSELELHSISVEQLRAMMASGNKISLFDVRQPLDLLAYPELIPGAKRIAPQEVLDQPSLIPRDEDVVVYCTCPGDKTSRRVLHRALALGITRIRFLTGGLAAWKGMGYPVQPYQESFRLSSPAVAQRAQ